MLMVSHTPMMAPMEIAIVSDLLSAYCPRRVLEWGIGGSTVHWSQLDFIESWTVIEHDAGWVEIYKSHLPDKVIARHINFPAYWQHSGDYDFVLVDGRERVKCLKTASQMESKPLVVLHDAARPRYKPAWDFFEHVLILTPGNKNDGSPQGPWHRGLAAFWQLVSPCEYLRSQGIEIDQ